MSAHMRPEAKALIDAMSLHAVPLLVYPRDEPKTDGWLTGGTGVLIQTPITRFIVTANHVVVEMEALRTLHPTVVLLGGTRAPPLDISDWKVVDRNKDIDICIIEVPDSFEPRDINKSFYSADFTTSRVAAEDDEALILGFPRAHRTASGSVINARMLPIIDFVTSVSETRFVVADPESEREVLENPSGLDVPEHMGGASGAPVFRLSLDGPCELIGIFTGGSDGLHGAYFCTHVRFLANNGRVDLLQLPPY
jgi:hypothetical protein